MILTRLKLISFAGIAERILEFDRGVNTILGPNEAGKSTVYRAIDHALFTPTKLRKPEFERAIGPLLPRPHGDSISCELTIAGDGEREGAGEYVIRKRWGASAETVVTTPGGQEVRDEARVQAMVRGLLPVREATMRRVFLAPQTALRNTIPEISGDTEATEELGEALRRSLFETGGVKIDAFRRRLEEEVAALYSRWDVERDSPEGGRGIDRPWKQGVGEILSAHYEAASADRDLRSAETLEGELASAGDRAAELAGRLDERRRFVDENRPLAESLQSLRVIQAERKSVETDIAAAQEHNARWPVLEAKVEEAQELDRSLASRAEEIAAEKEAAKAAARRRRLLERYEDIAEKQGRLESAKARFAEKRKIEQSDVRALSEAERAVDRFTESFSIGSVGLTLEGAAGPISYRVDLEEEAKSDKGGLSLTGHRRIVAEVGELRIIATAGEIDVDELEAQLSKARLKKAEIAERLGVDNSTEAMAALSEYRTVFGEVDSARAAFEEALGGDKFEALAVAATESSTAEGEGEIRGAEEIAAEEARVDQKRRALKEQLSGFRAERERLAERYGSPNDLVLRLGRLAVRREELAKQAAESAAVPQGFESPESFLSFFATAEKEVSRLKDELSAVRLEQARLEERLPDESAEEIRTRLERARNRLDRAKRRGAALLRVKRSSNRILTDLDSGTMDRYREVLARHVVRVTGGAYDGAALHGGSGDEGIPRSFRSAGGVDLPLELLSTGTRDSIALAVRLAIAEVLLDGGGAPLILDDSLVDLDPVRQRRAAEGILEYADGRQVLFFTCHPPQVELFAGSRHIEMNA